MVLPLPSKMTEDKNVKRRRNVCEEKSSATAILIALPKDLISGIVFFRKVYENMINHKLYHMKTNISFLTPTLMKEVRTASLEAKKKIAEEKVEKPAAQKKPEKNQVRLPDNEVNKLEKEFLTDEELEDSTEETNEETETSVVEDTEESSLAEESSRSYKEDVSSEDQVVKMEY